MDIKKLVKSTSYLDFINSIDNLIFEILYSKENGYILLNSKDAIKEVQNCILRFDHESSKIAANYDFSDIDKILSEKKQQLIFQIEKHYKKQVLNWVYDVYKNLKDNCIFVASINKNEPKVVSLVKSKAHSALDWFSDIQNYDELEKTYAKNELDREFSEAISKKDEDYIQGAVCIKTNPDDYLNLRSLIIEDESAFLNLDLVKFSKSLTNEDLMYFKKVQNKFTTYEKTQILDEINLIDCAISILNIEQKDKKYDFIKQIINDFEMQKANKKLNEEDKIVIIKRRMELYQNALKYYKNKLTS